MDADTLPGGEMILIDPRLTYRREVGDRMDQGRISESQLEYLCLMAEAKVEFDAWDQERIAKRRNQDARRRAKAKKKAPSK